jgi:dihydroorotate dehydrogenase (NAD+) catalytic subunit
MAIDVNNFKPSLGGITGGLSGPAIKPIALFMVYEVAKVIRVPVIGCGGIACAADALEFIMAGASAVQIGTANFFDPHCAISILEGISYFMKDKGIHSLTDIIGIARG